MIKPILKGVALCGAIAGVTFGGATLAQALGSAPEQKSPESSVESTAPENSAKDGDNVQFTAPGDADYRGKAAALKRTHKRAGARHTGSRAKSHKRARSAQDQTNPPNENANETTGDNESSAEPEAGQPGEPANGHADPAGQDSNHDCTGNCVE